MKTKQHRLTETDHKLFDVFVQKWKLLLNLQNWRVERVPGTTKAMADIAISREDRLAGYRTGKTFGSTTPVTPHSLEQTALHELLHVFFDDFKDAVKSNNEDYIMSAEHSLITVLENLLLKDNSCSDSLSPSSSNSAVQPLCSPSSASTSLETATPTQS